MEMIGGNRANVKKGSRFTSVLDTTDDKSSNHNSS